MRKFRIRKQKSSCSPCTGGRPASRTSTGLTVGGLNRRRWCLLSATTRPPILLQPLSPRIEGSRALAAVFRRRKSLQYLEAHTGQVPPEARRESPATRRASDRPTQSVFVPYHRAAYVNRDSESWEGSARVTRVTFLDGLAGAALVTPENMRPTPAAGDPKFP